MRLQPHVDLASAIATVQDLLIECGNYSGSATSYPSRCEHYRTWVGRADQQLRNTFTDDEPGQSLYTTSYWELTRLHPESPQSMGLLEREIQLQSARLLALRIKMQRLQLFVGHPGEIVIPDTSALVRGELFTGFDWPTRLHLGPPVRLIIPILVVEELDRLKDSERTTKAGDKARRVLKVLRELCRTLDPAVPAPVRTGTTVEVFLDDDWHLRRSIPDAEIIEQALSIESLTGKKVTLVCVDAAMEFRARQFGLKVQQMPTPDEVRQSAES